LYADAKFTVPTIVCCYALTIGPYLFYIEIFITQFKTTEKMIGHCTHFQENDNLPFWQDPAINKKAPFFNVLR